MMKFVGHRVHLGFLHRQNCKKTELLSVVLYSYYFSHLFLQVWKVQHLIFSASVNIFFYFILECSTLLQRV
jgi:hypothetical protein